MTKLPGQAVRGSTTGRPVMVIMDVLGKRWTLRLLWELNRQGPGTFRELQARCEDVSPTSLNNRLKDLRNLNLIENGERGFVLTEHGLALSALLAPLDQWANGWAKATTPP
ncbi:MAG: winged helix-turn-helix transcriptional regulator [Parasphingorhabdus sp.]|uniref:winged helix-turn-helix transcriptional regulator n=1 Tax=Parasphingorhabdus sp. TaxID=2709688 RepID=UPI00329990FD